MDNTTKKQVLEAIFSNNLLNRSMQTLAEAIVLGKRCGEVGLQGIQADVSTMIEELLVYYGHSYSDEDIGYLKEIAARDIRQFYPHLTIEEIKYGIRQAAHKKYGEVKHYNKFSLDFMNQLLSKYENSEDRKRVLHAYNIQRHETQAQPFTGLSEDDKRRICYESLIKVFEQYKQSGPANLLIPSHHYDYLLDIGACPPDYADFIPEARQNVRRAQLRKRQVLSASDTITEATTASELTEAKRLALVALYGNLVRNNSSIIDYMKPYLSISKAV